MHKEVSFPSIAPCPTIQQVLASLLPQLQCVPLLSAFQPNSIDTDVPLASLLQTIVAGAPAGGIPTITEGVMPIAEDTVIPTPMRMVRHRRSSEQERH